MIWRKRIAVGLAVLLIGATVYAVVVDLDGKPAPTTDAEEVVKRVGTRVTEGGDNIEAEFKRQQRRLSPPKSQGKTIKKYKAEMSNLK